MTPTESALREEAEKVAVEIVTSCFGDHRYHKPVTDALLAFAQRRGARERLRGRIEELLDLRGSGGVLRPGSMWSQIEQAIRDRLAEYQNRLDSLEKGASA